MHQWHFTLIGAYCNFIYYSSRRLILFISHVIEIYKRNLWKLAKMSVRCLKTQNLQLIYLKPVCKQQQTSYYILPSLVRERFKENTFLKILIFSSSRMHVACNDWSFDKQFCQHCRISDENYHSNQSTYFSLVDLWQKVLYHSVQSFIQIVQQFFKLAKSNVLL